MNISKLVEAAKDLRARVKQGGSMDELCQSIETLNAAIAENENFQEQYDHVVSEVAESLIDSLDFEDDRDLDQQASEYFHDTENNHPWLLDDEKCFVVLMHSEYPCAELWSQGSSVETMDQAFQFGAHAAAAMTEDVKKHLRDEFGFEGPLTRKMVRAARKKLSKK